MRGETRRTSGAAAGERPDFCELDWIRHPLMMAGGNGAVKAVTQAEFRIYGMALSCQLPNRYRFA